MSDIKRLLSVSSLYFFGNVLSKSIAFLMLPIYTKYLLPEELGEYDLYYSYVMFFASIFYMDVWIAVLKFYIGSDSEEEKKDIINSGAGIFIVCSLIYILGFYTFLNFMNYSYKIIIISIGLFMNLSTFLNYLARAKGKNKIIVISGIFNALGLAVSNIILILCFKLGVISLLISTVIGSFISSIIIFSNIKIKLRFNINQVVLKNILLFSSPLIINSISYWLMNGYGKVYISNNFSLHDNGLYNVALRLTSILSLLMICFKMAWQEVAFSKKYEAKEEISSYFSAALNNYIIFIISSSTLLVFISKFIINVFIDSKYSLSIEFIPMTVFAAAMFGISEFISSVINSINKNNIISIASFLAAILNVSLLYLSRVLDISEPMLVPIAMAISYFIMICIQLTMIRYYISIKIRYFLSLFLLLLFFITSRYIIDVNYMMAVVPILVTLLIIFYMLFKHMRHKAENNEEF